MVVTMVALTAARPARLWQLRLRQRWHGPNGDVDGDGGDSSTVQTAVSTVHTWYQQQLSPKRPWRLAVHAA
jgi:hypothetical protein